MGLFTSPTVSYEDYQEVLDEVEALLERVQAQSDQLDAAHEELAAREPTEWLEAVMTKRLVVHLTNDSTIVGSLSARMDDGIVLRAAVLMDGSPNGTSMAGEVFVPRDKVAFAQLDG